jgi:hypothetical protein
MFRTLIASATKGTATKVPQILYDPYGRILSVVEVNISGAGLDTTAIHSGDSAAGAAAPENLLGTYPSPTVPGFGVWTGYTPTLVQSGNLSPTVNQARWQQIGHLLIVQFKLTTTAAGTAGSNVLLGGPTSGPTSTTPKVIANQGVGYCQINGFGSGNYGCCLIRFNSGTTSPVFDFMRADINTVTGAMGVDPNSTIGIGAILQGTFMYEIT